MNKTSRAVLAVAAVATAGCTNLNGGSLGDTFFAEGFLGQEIAGSDYNASLARAYQEVAATNASYDGNWLDTTVYNDRARAAAAGNPPALFMPSEYGVNGELEALRAQTIAAVGGHGGERPQACATAAAQYDRLVEVAYQWGKEPNVVDSVTRVNYAPPSGGDFEIWPYGDAKAAYDAAYAECVGFVGDMTVFFGFNSATLDAVANSVVDDIAASVAGASSAISVVGHTDTVGSLQYNQALSERRAAAVANRMTAMGVDGSRITQAGRSWLEPAVDTGPGVREARNRRVEIVVSD